MTTKEQTARKIHNSGSSCSYAVFAAFNASGTAPAPRSEGGKCGAVLSAEKVLGQKGLDAGSFDERFLSTFGSLKCADLRKGKYPCNDLVGTAAAYVEEMMG